MISISAFGAKKLAAPQEDLLPEGKAQAQALRAEAAAEEVPVIRKLPEGLKAIDEERAKELRRRFGNIKELLPAAGKLAYAVRSHETDKLLVAIQHVVIPNADDGGAEKRLKAQDA